MTVHMDFYVDDLARRWQAVAIAASKDRERPALARSVHVEVYEGRGVRLVSTDSYLLLTAWVPCTEERDAGIDTPPESDEAPSFTGTAVDPDGRGLGMLRYAVQLDNRDELADPLVVQLGLGIVADGDTGAFDGMDPQWVTLDLPGMEQVRLPTYEGEYPAWRRLLSEHERTSTEGLALNPELLGRLGGLAKLYPYAPLVWYFGGPDRVARLELEGHGIDGLCMPVRHDVFGPSVEDDTSDELDDPAMVRLAAEITMAAGYGSVATIQRKASVSYARAAQALDRLLELGIVGDAIGSKARPVMVDLDRCDAILDVAYPRPADDEAA